MTELTYNDLPQAVTQLYNKLENIERLLLEKSTTAHPQPESWFDLNELVKYDPERRTKPTFYGYIHRREIPFHKRSKKVVFLKSEIDSWLMQGRKKTFAETASEADKYLLKRKGGVNHG
jgi:hypothetical protein